MLVELGWAGMFISALLAATLLPLGSEAVLLTLLAVTVTDNAEADTDAPQEQPNGTSKLFHCVFICRIKQI